MKKLLIFSCAFFAANFSHAAIPYFVKVASVCTNVSNTKIYLPFDILPGSESPAVFAMSSQGTNDDITSVSWISSETANFATSRSSIPFKPVDSGVFSTTNEASIYSITKVRGSGTVVWTTPPAEGCYAAAQVNNVNQSSPVLVSQTANSGNTASLTTVVSSGIAIGLGLCVISPDGGKTASLAASGTNAFLRVSASDASVVSMAVVTMAPLKADYTTQPPDLFSRQIGANWTTAVNALGYCIQVNPSVDPPAPAVNVIGDE